MTTRLNEILTRHSLRLTKPRQLVFDTLLTATQPRSIANLSHALPMVDKVSIYRTIELFTRLGITAVVNHGWKQRYELAAPFKPHHHHLHCIACESHTEIHSKQLEALIATISEEHGFAPQQHHFEISGLCERCQADHTTTRSVN